MFVDEFKTEVQLSPERLAELQRTYAITDRSVELEQFKAPEYQIIMVADWKRPEETDAAFAVRLQEQMEHARKQATDELKDKKRTIMEVNAAIRKTRHH